MITESGELAGKELVERTQLERFVQGALGLVVERGLRTSNDRDQQHQIEYCLGMELAWILVNMSYVESYVPGLFFTTQFTAQQTVF